MGFMKQLMVENGLNASIANKQLRKLEKKVQTEKEKKALCSICGSDDVSYEKIVMSGKDRLLYHYRQICLSCGKKCYVKRNKEVYELVKNKPWRLSKKLRTFNKS
jgi:superfamily II helicase